MTDLGGKTVLITGATSGIGLKASIAMARMGARVVMVGRDPSKTTQKVAEVRTASGNSMVDSLLCDLASQAQIHALADSFLSRYDRLDVLVNNAGTVYARRTLTEDHLEATFAVNYLSVFLLTNLLLDRLIRSAPARVVNVASNGHYGGTLDFNDLGFERGYQIMRAYSRSKLAEACLRESSPEGFRARASRLTRFTRARWPRTSGTGPRPLPGRSSLWPNRLP